MRMIPMLLYSIYASPRADSLLPKDIANIPLENILVSDSVPVLCFDNISSLLSCLLNKKNRIQSSLASRIRDSAISSSGSKPTNLRELLASMGNTDPSALNGTSSIDQALQRKIDGIGTKAYSLGTPELVSACLPSSSYQQQACRCDTLTDCSTQPKAMQLPLSCEGTDTLTSQECQLPVSAVSGSPAKPREIKGPTPKSLLTSAEVAPVSATTDVYTGTQAPTTNPLIEEKKVNVSCSCIIKATGLRDCDCKKTNT